MLFLGVAAAAAAAPGPSKGPSSLLGRRERVEAAQARLDSLLARARIPVELDRIRLYRSYTPEQLEQKSKSPDAEELLKIAKNGELAQPVREEAAEALLWDSALRNDPELDSSGKGMARPRAKFTLKVLPMLSDADVTTRELGRRLCLGFWPGARDRDMENCVAGDKASCQAARMAWTRYIAR
jgi:hypothetical protein